MMDRRNFLSVGGGVIAAAAPLVASQVGAATPEIDVPSGDDFCVKLADLLKAAGIEGLLPKKGPAVVFSNWCVRRFANHHNVFVVYLDVTPVNSNGICLTKHVAISRYSVIDAGLEIGPELANRMVAKLKDQPWEKVGIYDVDCVNLTDLRIV